MRKIILLLLVSLCSIAGFAQTEGTLEAIDKNGKILGNCPLKHTSVKADVSGFLARVTVVQEFENRFAQPIEAVYAFPLPNAAAVDDLTMRIGERTIRGKIMRRDEAKKIYETAKTEGKTASLLDQERPNIFTQSIANVLPNEKISVEISYVETLKYEDGSYEFVFPMTITPRYIPGSMPTNDAAKVSPPTVKSRAGHDISITVNIDAGVPVEEIRSTSHEIQTARLDANNAGIKLKTENEIPNKDFVLRYDVSGKRVEEAVLTHRDAGGGFFSLILQPPDTFRAEDIAPKEIVFVLDTSGSMAGFPIEKAKEAMRLSLDNLYPNDTFNLITFAGDTHILFEQPIPATQANLERAKAFLESRQGGGGTEMMTAIRAALAPSDSQQHVRIVCFMTDGAVGNDLEIIGEVRKHSNARVFSFGIGSSVNRFLLDKIAEEGRGEAEYVALTDDGSKAAKKFYERVRTPLLTDVSIDWNGLPIADVYPKRINDLFSAKPVVVHGRYLKSGKGTIKLRGRIGGQETVREIAVVLPETESRNEVLATLWARTRIDDLMAKDYAGVQNGNADQEVQNTITNIGLEYRLLTQFTSFVAVEEIVRTQGGRTKKIEVPVNLPEGVNGETTLNATVDVSSNAIVSTNTRSLNSLPVNGRRSSKIKLSQSIGSGRGSGNGNGSGNGIGSGNGSGNGMAAPPPPKKISGGVLNGKAMNLPLPSYPAAAKTVRAGGAVNIQVTIDESGNVVSASAVSGHHLLRAAAEQAARAAKFAPTMLSGRAVKTTGVIVYNFADNQNSATVSTGEMSAVENQVQSVAATETPAETAISEKAAKIRLMVAEKFHVWLYAVVERLRQSETLPTANEAKFVKDGKAKVQIRFRNKTPQAIEKLESLGFETAENKSNKIIVGKISLEKIAALAEIGEVQYVLPKIN